MVVVMQILRYFSFPDFQSPGQPDNTFLLYRPVEALQVGIVIGRPDSAVTVNHVLFSQLLSEPLGKFRAMVSLDGLEPKRGNLLGCQHELSSTSCTNPRCWLGIGPAGVNIK